MNRVIYEIDASQLKKKYLELFRLDAMNKDWKVIRAHLKKKKCVPKNIEEILIADASNLVDMYQKYIAFKVDKKTEEKIKKLFDYNKYQPLIANFLMDPNNGLKIHTCHYCNTAYINAYGLGNIYKTKLDFIKNARKKELINYIKTGNKCISEGTADHIIAKRDKINTLDDFDKLTCWRKPKKSDSIELSSFNHFDLDHVLGKAACPILSLSLYNFVPSCQVCNQKLKKDKTIGDSNNAALLLKLNPVNPQYDFDANVEFKIIPESGSSTYNFEENLENYKLDIYCKDADYEASVSLFKLRQRYNYHKAVALRLLDLKERYADGNITMISNLLQSNNCCKNKYTEEQIKEDLFEIKSSKQNHRCFDKLKRDILK